MSVSVLRKTDFSFYLSPLKLLYLWRGPAPQGPADVSGSQASVCSHSSDSEARLQCQLLQAAGPPGLRRLQGLRGRPGRAELHSK